MRILVVHNFYQQPGGEDGVFRDEVQLLRDHGHDVFTWRVHNRTIRQASKLRTAINTIWSPAARKRLRSLVRKHGAEVVHFHNTFPLLSPAVYGGAKAEGAATVQTLHNYRLLCVNGLLLRDGAACELCVGRVVPTPAVVHRCYRGSALGSTTVAAMLTVNRVARTWETGVDRFIALTDFARDKMIEGGLPADRIVVKPNFLVADAGPGDGAGGYALYVGRLSQEKGIDTLLHAWAQTEGPQRLIIIGDGPLGDLVQRSAASDGRIQWLRQQPPARVMEAMQAAACVVIPSRCYEGLPKVFIEAMACGTPVVASRVGSLAELVAAGDHGVSVDPDHPPALAAAMSALMNDPSRLRSMRRAARQVYLDQHTAKANHARLLSIYEAAIGRSAAP